MSNSVRFVGPNFTMTIPSAWMVIASTRFQVIFLSPPLRDGRSLNLSLLIQQSADSEQVYADSILKPQAQTQPAYHLIADETFTTDAQVVGVHFAFHAHYPEVGMVQTRHVIFQLENTLYQFTAALPLNLEDSLCKKVDALVIAMLKSFMFTAQNLEDLLG